MSDLSWANVNWNTINRMREEAVLGQKTRREDMLLKRKLRDAIELEEQKARIKAESSPFAGLGESSEAIEDLGIMGKATGDPRFRDMASQISGRFLGRMGGQPTPSVPSSAVPTLPATAQINRMQPLPITTGAREPVLGTEGTQAQDMIRESATVKPGMFGQPQLESQKFINPEAGLMKKRMETKADLERGGVVSLSNLETVASAAKDMLSVLSEAIEEDGAGGRIQSTISGAAEWMGDLPRWLGGHEIGGMFPASGAFSGKKFELLLKMMPMLTQQATKPEGSVRLIESVLRALGATLPDKNIAKTQAGRMTAESILSFYRFARATKMAKQDFDEIFFNIDLSRLDDEDYISDEQLDGITVQWVASVNRVVGRIDIIGDEKQAVDSLMRSVISPLQRGGKIDDKMLPVFLQGETNAQPQQPVFGQSNDPEYERYLQSIGAR